MKYVAIFILLFVSGCGHVRFCDGRYIEAKTFFKDIDLDRLGIDPNTININGYHSRTRTETLEKLLLLVAEENLYERDIK